MQKCRNDYIFTENLDNIFPLQARTGKIRQIQIQTGLESYITA